MTRSLRHGQIPCTRIHARGVVLFVCKSARANPPTAEVETSNLQCRVVCVSVCECVRELERARPPHRTHAQSVERAFTCFRTASRDRGRRRGDRGTPTPSPNPRDVMWRPLEPSVACGFRICCFFFVAFARSCLFFGDDCVFLFCFPRRCVDFWLLPVCFCR